MSPEPARSSRKGGSAWPPGGHQEFAYTKRGARVAVRPPHVCALGIHVNGEVDDRLASAEQGANPKPPGEPHRRSEDEPGDRGGAQRRGEETERRSAERQ